MKLLSLAVLLLISTAWSQEVKHAPTVEQCRADQTLWLATIEDMSSPNPVGFQELDGWFTEMHNCEKVDPENHSRYYNTMSEVGTEQMIRLEKFLLRHNLYQQFINEDAAGKR